MTKHENLATALAAFQAELPKLTKDQSAKVTGQTDNGTRFNYTYGYADLSQVTEAISPVLGKHGLSYTAFPTMLDNGVFVLFYALLHEAGEVREGTWPLPDPMRTKPQQLGSAITYARRYAFMAVTNTFPGGEDDDGAAAVPTAHHDKAMGAEDIANLPRERPQNAPTTPAAPKVFTDEEVQGMQAKLDTLELDKAGTLYDWMAGRDLHSRPIDGVDATTRLAVRLATVAAAPETTVENISWVREFADGRGLLKTQVSPKSSLADWLTDQKDARVQAAVAQSETAQQMKRAASDSWDTGTDDGSPSAAPGQGD